MSGGATFGRKQTVDSSAMEARRAAFIAAERARTADAGDVERPRAASPATPVYVAQKSQGTAYLIWFFLGGLSAHRFYLGHSTSGAIQVALSPIGYALIINGSFLGLAFTGCGALWILADAFLLPSMVRTCNERLRRLSVSAVFA